MVNLLVLIYFFIGSLYVTYPLISNFTSALSSKGDELLITWILNWNIHAFFSNPLNIFNANIYYPYLNSLAFSDSFFTSALISIIPVKIFNEPVVAYNFNILFSLITLGFFTYLFTYYLTKNHFSAVISGTLVVFSTYTLNRTMHLQLISIQWIPLALLFFLKFARSGIFKYLLLSSLFFILQTANSFLPGYFLIICFLSFLLIFYLKEKSFFNRFFTKKVFLLCLITGLILLPLTIPYFQVSKEFNYTRDIRDAIHFANRLEYIFYPNDKTRLKNFLLTTVYANDKGPYKYDGYFSGALFILTGVSLIYFFVKKIDIVYISFLFIGISSFILSLGPVFQWGGKVIKYPFMIPLPYALFYYLVPGFKGFRNSARWEMLTVFAFSVTVGLMLSTIFKKRSKLFKLLITIIICGSVFLEFNFPITIVSIPKISEFPSVYSYIKTLPEDTVIIEMPIYNWNMLPYSREELLREYFSTLHFKKMVNGGSGFSPPPWQELVKEILFEFPSPKSITLLKAMKVNYIIVHNDQYKMLTQNKFRIRESLDLLRKNKDLILIGKFGNDTLYKIL